MRFLAHFLKTTFRLHNIGMFFYVLMDLLFLLLPVYGILIAAGAASSASWLLPIIALAYIVIVMAWGEVIVRLVFGGSRVVMGENTNAVSLAFMEAYRDAKELDPDLSENIKLYVCRESFPDAYAFGRNTIMITEQAMSLSHNDLKILFLEKFAQISNNDSDRIQLLIAGNCLFVVFVFLIKVIVYVTVAAVGLFFALLRFILSLFTRVRSGGGMFAFNAYLNVCRIIADGAERALTFFFNLFIRLALLSIRSGYYINDAFVCDCGYSQDLRYFLEYVAVEVSGFNSTLGTITSAKPSRLSRVSRLQSGVQTPIAPVAPVTPFEDVDPAAQIPFDPAAQIPFDPAAQTPFDLAAQTPSDPAEQNHATNSRFRVVSRTPPRDEQQGGDQESTDPQENTAAPNHRFVVIRKNI